MLVLTRKPQERIQIGENITITIVRIKGRAVRVGIEAPDSVRIVRGELTADFDPPAEPPAEHRSRENESCESTKPSMRRGANRPNQNGGDDRRALTLSQNVEARVDVNRPRRSSASGCVTSVLSATA